MTTRKQQDTITIAGKTFFWTWLPASASTELFFELAPAILPAILEAVTHLPMTVGEGGATLHAFKMSELKELPDALRKLLKELPYSRFNAITHKALANTTFANKPLMKDTNFDLYVDGTAMHLELVGRALILQYSDFYDALAGLGLRRAGAASSSSEQTTSAGPSTDS